MSDLRAIRIVDGELAVSHKEFIKAWQHLIDTGMCWKMQGRYGRIANQMIDDGLCRYDRKVFNY